MEPQAEAGQIFFLLGEAIPAAFVGLSQWKRDVAEFPPKSSQDVWKSSYGQLREISSPFVVEQNSL